jgi:hypothetical protein
MINWINMRRGPAFFWFDSCKDMDLLRKSHAFGYEDALIVYFPAKVYEDNVTVATVEEETSRNIFE